MHTSSACLSDKMRTDLRTEVELDGALRNSLPRLRHIYDVPLMMCMKHLDASMEDFQGSRHYQYLLALKAKESQVPTIDWFKVTRMLGRGAFGNVLEVIKRDCECKYAMKVQSKSRLEETFGEVWDELALVERSLMTNLHHPLLVNLAYAFQTVEHLILVMDACPNGDLRKYATAESAVRLSAEQVRFVGLEVVMVLLYLHAQAVLYRDLKPENLLLDSAGHVRVTDLGASKQGDPASGTTPTSTELCGTAGYMAPEIKLIDETSTPYGAKADWFAFGVVMYQLTEREMPFGKDPEFVDFQDEYREPKLIDKETGVEVPHLFDLLSDLLDWEPESRVGDESIKAASYWSGADWELLDIRRHPSPMRTLLLRSENEDDAHDLSEAASLALGGVGSIRPAIFSRRSSAANDDSLEEASHFAAVLAKDTHDKAAVEEADGDPTTAAHPRRISEARVEELERKELLMEVEGWDFVSSHALAHEYVHSAGAAFSFV